MAVKTLAQRSVWTLVTLAVACVGVAIAIAVSFPAPFLTGPAIAVTLFNVLLPRLEIHGALMQAALVVLGMNIGAGVSPEVLETAQRWPVSFIVLAVCLVLIMSASTRWLKRFNGFDDQTAFLSSTPGHLSYVLGLSADIDADIARISFVQTVRVLALTLIVPVLVTFLGGEIGETIVPHAPMGLVTLAVIFVLSLALGRAFIWLRVPAALLLGAMCVSTLLHLTGIVSGSMPDWLTMPAFLIMGAMIGSRFSGVSLAMLKNCFGAGVAVTLISSLIASFFAVLVGLWLDMPLGQVIIAFMPGGLEAMIAMAVILGADPTFVAAHHIMRLFLLSVMVPVMASRHRRR